MGNPESQDRPMLIKLENVKDKATVFRSISKLKGKENVKRRLFTVDDDMDTAQAESKFYYRSLVKKNKQLPEEERLIIKMSKGNIMVNNEKLKPHLLEPTMARLITMSEDEQTDIREVKLVKSEEFSERGYDYIAYIQKVRSYKDVQKGFVAI